MNTHKSSSIPGEDKNLGLAIGSVTCIEDIQTPQLWSARPADYETHKTFTVRVPATTANLGPGFDCLGMALDLWNETTFSMPGNLSHVIVQGEGIEQLPFDHHNLVFRAVASVFEFAGEKMPEGLKVHCHNQIPLKSGLGSSSAAVLTGLLAGNMLLKDPIHMDDLIALGIEIEGHPDNVIPALYGGLAVISRAGGKVLAHKVPVPKLNTVIVLPDVDLPTRVSRNALPKAIPYHDAVFNAGQIYMVVEALKSGDLEMLAHAMQDRLHQPYRLPLIPGAEEALQAVQNLGYPAALSGAGPSLVTFAKEGKEHDIVTAMQASFDHAGISTRVFLLSTSPLGAQIIHHEIG